MSNSVLKYFILITTVIFIVYIVKVGLPFIKEYLELQGHSEDNKEYKIQLKALNHKYGKKLVPPVVIFIAAFILFGILVGGSCC
jgi:hypothetical protein